MFIVCFFVSSSRWLHVKLITPGLSHVTLDTMCLLLLHCMTSVLFRSSIAVCCVFVVYPCTSHEDMCSVCTVRHVCGMCNDEGAQVPCVYNPSSRAHTYAHNTTSHATNSNIVMPFMSGGHRQPMTCLCQTTFQRIRTTSNPWPWRWRAPPT